MQNVVFRVDASLQIGSGHVMRCLTLAERLRSRENADILFITRDLEGNLIDLIREKGYSVAVLSRADHSGSEPLTGYGAWLTVTQKEDARETVAVLQKRSICQDLIVDSYAIDQLWEREIRPYVNRIVVIDDLANRIHDCDILLDQNFYLDKEHRYKGLVPSSCHCFLGPQYALLREEFYTLQKTLRVRTGALENVLVFYGGSDLTDETSKALSAIAQSRLQAYVHVIVGHRNPHREKIRRFCETHTGMSYHCQIDNIGTYMCLADVSFGAGGTTTWERCFLGLPTLVTAVADNQIKICEDCDRAGYIRFLGTADKVTKEQLVHVLYEIQGKHVLKQMQEKCRLDVSQDHENRTTLPSSCGIERCLAPISLAE